jgi:putative DNA primase/helicase
MLRSLKLVGDSYKPKPFKKTWIQFNKTIYDYKTKERFDSSPEFFNANPIPFEIGKTDKTPTIDKLFKEWVGEDYVLMLKQVISVSMLQDYPFHRIICLHGRGLNGKGVFLKFLRKLIGKNNICSANLKRLIKGDFESSKLYKKLVCQVSETDFSTLKDTSIIKQLTGQDLVSTSFKGKDGFDFENFATLFIATNSLPLTEDRTDGFYRRWMILDFPNQFEEGKDILGRIPEVEYNNFCLQMLDVVNKLIDKGIFSNDGTIQERKQRYEDKSNPLKLFIRSTHIPDFNEKVPFFEFYDDFNNFCVERGFRELSKSRVSKILNEIGYHTEKKDIKIGSDWKTWVFVMGLKKMSNPSSRYSPTFNSFVYKRNKVKQGEYREEGRENILMSEIEELVPPELRKCNVCGNTPVKYFSRGKYYDKKECIQNYISQKNG